MGQFPNYKILLKNQERIGVRDGILSSLVILLELHSRRVILDFQTKFQSNWTKTDKLVFGMVSVRVVGRPGKQKNNRSHFRFWIYAFLTLNQISPKLAFVADHPGIFG